MCTVSVSYHSIGSMGSIYGLLHAFLHSKPMNIHVTSYGINTAIFTGTFLGCRYYTLQLLNHQYGGSSMNTVPVIQQQKNNELYASTISSAIVGGVATGSICKYSLMLRGVCNIFNISSRLYLSRSIFLRLVRYQYL